MNMKAVALMFLASFLFLPSFSQKKSVDNQRSQRIEKIINSQWTFNYFPDAEPGKGLELSVFDDSRWPAISLPFTWGTYETTGLLSNAPDAEALKWRTGWGWYRKHFSVNNEYSGRKVFVELSDVRSYCKVWLNGKYIGDHKGDGRFYFDVTSNIMQGTDNLLVIAVSCVSGENLKNGSGGIYGDIKLILKDKLYIPIQGVASHEGETAITTPLVSEKEGTVRIQTYVKNDYSQKTLCSLLTTITDTAGKIVQVLKSEADIDPGQLFKFEQISKTIKNPHLWSIADPYLYKIESSVMREKIVSDTYSSPLYFRFFKADENALVADTARSAGSATVKNNTEAKTDSVSIATGGETPVRILLTGSQNKIRADRGSVVTIKADLIDGKGNHTGFSNYTLKWNVSGPARLIGPQIMDQSTGTDQPFSNSIRSSGLPGKIHVTVSSSGLVSGTFDIESEPVIADNSVITEPILQNEGRQVVKRSLLVSKRLDAVPVEIKFCTDEIDVGNSDKQGCKKLIREYIAKNNPSVDTSTVEFNFLTDILALQLRNSGGKLQPEDYNFNIDHFNNCRLIARYINSTKLPQLFKDGLRKYYSDAIIKMGNEKDAGDEMNWLNWIPSGGTVVYVQSDKLLQVPKGAVLAKNDNLQDIIATVYPQFANFSAEAKERALLFTGKVNPYVHTGTGDDKSSYIAEKGQPILVPLLKFISE